VSKPNARNAEKTSAATRTPTQGNPCRPPAAAEESGADSLPMPAIKPTQAESIPAFSLSRTVERILPTALISEADGKFYPIDADFHTVLACLRKLADPDLPELEKLLYLAGRFYLRHPPRDPDRLFAAFVTGGAQDDTGEPPMLDFERDAGAIYASFRQQYGIDLLRESLHWVEFRELLAGLGEDTPFGARVRLRGLDEARVPPEDRASLRRLKERVAIAPRVSRAEQTLLTELNRRLAAGEDPVEIIEKLQEV